jgi:hypothetical protein
MGSADKVLSVVYWMSNLNDTSGITIYLLNKKERPATTGLSGNFPNAIL